MQKQLQVRVRMNSMQRKDRKSMWLRMLRCLKAAKGSNKFSALQQGPVRGQRDGNSSQSGQSSIRSELPLRSITERIPLPMYHIVRSRPF